MNNPSQTKDMNLKQALEDWIGTREPTFDGGGYPNAYGLARNDLRDELTKSMPDLLAKIEQHYSESRKEKVCYECYRPVALSKGWHGTCPVHGNRSEQQVVWLMPEQIDRLVDVEQHVLEARYEESQEVLARLVKHFDGVNLATNIVADRLVELDALLNTKGAQDE